MIVSYYVNQWIPWVYLLFMCIHTTFELKLTIERVKLLLLRFFFLDVQFIGTNNTDVKGPRTFPPKTERPPVLYFITFDDCGTKEGRC